MVIAQRLELLAGYHADPHISEKIQHPELPSVETFGDGRLAGTRVGGAQRMIAAFSPRYDGIRLGRERQKMCQEPCGDKRHVARDEHEGVVTRRGERRVEAAQRPACRHPVANHTEPGRYRRGRALADHQHDVVRQRLQFGHLAVEDRQSAHDQGALVASAETARASAGEDCRTGHGASILSCGA